MGWSVGFDSNWQRDIGYGVPAVCDHPDCFEQIDRGLSYVCGAEPYGGAEGCGLFFCYQHLIASREFTHAVCARCLDGEGPFTPKPDVPEWLRHKLTDESWQRWRDENPDAVAQMTAALQATVGQQSEAVEPSDRKAFREAGTPSERPQEPPR